MSSCETKNSNVTNSGAAPGSRRSIVLVGLMGVGKSTVGKRLAARLGLEFADADDEIVEAAGLSIGDIFARYGEAHFREGERRVMERLMAGPQKVIATGGGAFIDPQTRENILNEATAVWLDAAIETLVERVSRRKTRPLLIGKDAGQVLRDLARDRNPLYAQAPIHIVSAPGPHSATVDLIVKALREHGEMS